MFAFDPKRTFGLPSFLTHRYAHNLPWKEARVSDFAAFGSLERDSWSDSTRASGYVELFASASDQAIEGLLDAGGAKPNLKVLDLCCGQGNVSEALIRRG